MITYVSGKFIIFAGVKFTYVNSLKTKTGITKEYYRCEICGARLHVFANIKKCQLVASHTDVVCSKTHLAHEKTLRAQHKSNLRMLESIMEETVMADQTTFRVDEDENETEAYEDENETEAEEDENETILVDVCSFSDQGEDTLSEDSALPTLNGRERGATDTCSLVYPSESTTMNDLTPGPEPRAQSKKRGPIVWTRAPSPIKTAVTVKNTNNFIPSPVPFTKTRSTSRATQQPAKPNNIIPSSSSQASTRPPGFRYFADSPSTIKKVKFGATQSQS